MKLSFTLNNIAFLAEGSSEEIGSVINVLRASGIKDARIIKPRSTAKIKTKTFDKPVLSDVSERNKQYIASLFTYPPSRTSPNGKPAYVMSIILDGKPRTVRTIMQLANCKQQTIRNVVDRMVKSGSVVHVSSNRMAENTIVQVQKITENAIQPAKRKQATKSVSNNTFKNLVI